MAKYSSLNFNHILETPPRPENVNILIIPGLPSRMFGSNTVRGVSIAYQRLNTLNPKWLGGDVAQKWRPKKLPPWCANFFSHHTCNCRYHVSRFTGGFKHRTEEHISSVHCICPFLERASRILLKM